MRSLLLFLALLLPVAAQDTLIRENFNPVNDTHVEVVAMFTKPSPGGFFPLRVVISNQEKFNARVTLNCESGAYFGGNTSSSSGYAFEAPAGKIVTRDILVPLGPPSRNYGGNTNLTVRMGGTFGTAEHTVTADLDPNQPSILLSEKLYTPNASILDSAAASRFTSGYRSSNEFAAKFDPAILPNDWLAFSGYDNVLMTDSDWSATPPGCRNAILSWVRLGGQLVIYTTHSATRASLNLPEETSYGTITIQPIEQDLKMDPPSTLDLVTKGRVEPRQVSLRTDYERKSNWPLQEEFGSQSFNYALFIAVLILFGILVGPVNLFVFAKSGQRHRLFITTPLISLGASLVMIVLIVVQDGFGGNGIRRVLMEVRPDNGENAAYLHQEQFARTGVLTSSRFTIDPACAFNPVPIESSRWARYTSANSYRGTFNLQPDGGKLVAAGDWFQSRSEHGHVLSAVIPSRGKIEATGVPDTYLSSFDFPIATLFYQNQQGQWFRADGIETGKQFKLTPVEHSMISGTLEEEAKGFAVRHRTFLRAAMKRPGHFIAITDEAPAIATNPGIRWKETRTIITGPIR
ncbi:MAG: hypothetical protein QM627_11335 [Luteolibacter sp.]